VKLAGFDLYRYELPLCEPLALRGVTLHRREGFLLELIGERGTTGWGEASPLPGFSRETLEEAAGGLRELAEGMTGREVTADLPGPHGALARELDRLDPAPSVRFAFELALWNLYAGFHGRSLPELVTPRPREWVPVNGLLAGLPEAVLECARRMKEAGYEAVKLKVGAWAVDEDLGLVRALNELLDDRVSLRLDANRAWSLKEAEAFARGAAGLRVDYLEEPLADPARLPSFARTSGVPVALDESLLGMAPGSLDEHRYARAVVLKPTLLGGISPTLRLAYRAVSLGITPVVSSLYEGGVGTMGLVALAAGLGGAPAGLDTYRRLAEDVLRPRLELPAPRVNVRATTSAPRELDRRRLTPVG
jgi:o-succinylbenzoate synthase